MSTNGKTDIPGDEVEITIDRIIPEGMRSTFANHIVVHNSGHGEFHISFFEIDHPMILGSPEETAAKMREIGSVRADCVARIVVSRDRVPAFIAALASVYNASLRDRQTDQPSDHQTQEQDKKHVG